MASPSPTMWSRKFSLGNSALSSGSSAASTAMSSAKKSGKHGEAAGRLHAQPLDPAAGLGLDERPARPGARIARSPAGPRATRKPASRAASPGAFSTIAIEAIPAGALAGHRRQHGPQDRPCGPVGIEFGARPASAEHHRQAIVGKGHVALERVRAVWSSGSWVQPALAAMAWPDKGAEEAAPVSKTATDAAGVGPQRPGRSRPERSLPSRPLHAEILQTSRQSPCCRSRANHSTVTLASSMITSNL